jgi:hypothetical protein
MTKTITLYDLRIFYNEGNAAVTFQADVYAYDDSTKLFEFGTKKYIYDGETTFDEFLMMFVDELIETAKDILNMDIEKYTYLLYKI